MNVLIVDDSNDKIAKIVSAIEEVSSGFNIDTVIDGHSAQLKLRSTKYDLMIVDLLLPIRPGEKPSKDGGLILTKEVTRKKILIPPSIIVGLTQHKEISNSFSPIWKLLVMEDESWSNHLKDILNHIDRSKRVESPTKLVKPSVFVEGNSDKEILLEAFNLFKPEYLDKLEIKSERSAGANWVANQIVTWAYSHHSNKGIKLKSVGLLDGDEAGKFASDEVNRVVKNGSAGAKSFQIIKLKPDYAKDLIPLYQKGLTIPITLEELYSKSFWEFAEKEGWLEPRGSSNLFLQDPKGWDKRTQSLNQFISSMELNSYQNRYLKSFKLTYKAKAVKNILLRKEKDKIEILRNFEGLIEDIIKYLF